MQSSAAYNECQDEHWLWTYSFLRFLLLAPSPFLPRRGRHDGTSGRGKIKIVNKLDQIDRVAQPDRAQPDDVYGATVKVSVSSSAAVSEAPRLI